MEKEVSKPHDDPLVRLASQQGEELEASVRLLASEQLVRVFMHSSITWSMFTADAQFAQATRMKKTTQAELLRRLNPEQTLVPEEKKELARLRKNARERARRAELKAQIAARKKK